MLEDYRAIHAEFERGLLLSDVMVSMLFDFLT